jgi:hypothetical protein
MCLDLFGINPGFGFLAGNAAAWALNLAVLALTPAT